MKSRSGSTTLPIGDAKTENWIGQKKLLDLILIKLNLLHESENRDKKKLYKKILSPMSISKFRSSFEKGEIDINKECELSIKIKKDFDTYIASAVRKSKKIRLDER